MVRFNITRQKIHLANAGKYFSAFTVAVFGVLHPKYSQSEEDRTAHNIYRAAWIAVFVFATLYQFSWDVFMDWGLSVKNCRRLTFPKALYAVFVPADLALRFLWTLTLIPADTADGPITADGMKIIAPFLAIAEVFRRLGWTLIRVEYEHLCNADSFSRIDFVPLHGEEEEEEEKEEAAREEGRDKTSLVVELGIVGAAVAVVSSLAYFSPN